MISTNSKTSHRRSGAARRAGAGLCVVAAAALLLSGALAAAEGSTDAPRQVIEQAMNEVVGVLQNKGNSPKERRDKIEAIAYARFDFDTMSQLVVGKKDWQSFSDKQRQEFTNEFKKHLSANYGRKLDSYTDQKIEVLKAREEPKTASAPTADVTVTTRITSASSSDKPIGIDYRMHERDGQWRIIDVKIPEAGFTTLGSFKAEVQSIASRKGDQGIDIDSVIQVLRKKNSQAES